MRRTGIAAGRGREAFRKGTYPAPGSEDYLPRVSTTPPVHQKPGRGIPPISQ